MLDGIKGLLGSKKGVIGLLVLGMNVAWMLTGRMSMSEFQIQQTIIVGSYFLVEGASGAVATVVGAKRAKAAGEKDVAMAKVDAGV